MAVKDISDIDVLKAIVECKNKQFEKFPYQLLSYWMKQPEKVCFRAMERAYRHGLLEYGVSLRTAWLTEKGMSILQGDN